MTPSCTACLTTTLAVAAWSAPAPASPSGGAAAPFQAAQATAASVQAAPTPEVAVSAHPSTIVLHLDTLAGRAVVVPSARVVRVMGSRLLAVTEATLHPEPIVRRELEELLVVLPAPAAVAPGDVLTLAGRVRTVSGMRREPTAAAGGEISRVLGSRRYRRAPVLEADVAQTLDGVAVISPPGRSN